jgi:hypothetical protein
MKKTVDPHLLTQKLWRKLMGDICIMMYVKVVTPTQGKSLFQHTNKIPGFSSVPASENGRRIPKKFLNKKMFYFIFLLKLDPKNGSLVSFGISYSVHHRVLF